MQALSVAAFCCLLPLFAACATPPPAPPPAQPKPYAMKAPSYLTDAARLRIRATMKIHRENMSGLFNSLLVLDRDATNRYAEAIADQQPLTQDPNLPKDEQIPDHLIDLQKELHAKAEELIKLVNSEQRVKSTDLANGFANLASVCVTCHSEYLYPEP